MATHQLAHDLKELVREIRGEGRDVRFFWLRAHVGTLGNERADELAKKAALTKKTAPDYDKVPISFVKKCIRDETVEKWQKRYESSSTGSVTKMFFPSVIAAKRIIRDIDLTPALVQIFTGHGGFSAYLHRFHLKDSPACVCDPSTEESVWHLLLECPRFSHDRMKLENELNVILDLSALSSIVEGKATRASFLDFAQKVVSVAARANQSTAVHTTHLQTNTQTTNTVTTNITPTNTHTTTTTTQTPTLSLTQTNNVNTNTITTRTTTSIPITLQLTQPHNPTTTIIMPTNTQTDTVITTILTTAPTQSQNQTANASQITTIATQTLPRLQTTFSPTLTQNQPNMTTSIIIFDTTTTSQNETSTDEITTTTTASDANPIPCLLAIGAAGEPGIRLRSVALFMNRPQETFGISFCRPRPSKTKVTIPPGLAALINGSTAKTSIKSRKYTDLPVMELFNIQCRVMRVKDKKIALLEWREETPFAQASSLLQRLREAGGDSARIISVDAMNIDGIKGEVADRLGCIKAAEVHEVIVYEDRGESLSYLKPPREKHTVQQGNPPSPQTTLSGSERMQQKIAEERETLQRRSTPERHGQGTSRLAGIKTGIKTFLQNVFTDRHSGATRSGISEPAHRQGEALASFLRKSPMEAGKSPPKKTPTRADKGQVSPPVYIPVTGPSDHIHNAFLEFLAIVRATKQANTLTCKKLLQCYNLQSEGLLKVLLEEADAAVYDNSTSRVIAGSMRDSYMAAYSATGGFVTRNEDESKRRGKPVFTTPDEDPIVVVAKCTEVMLDDRFLEMAQTISGTSTAINFKWVNGVPGCGKTTWVVRHFDGENDVVVTTTTEAAKDLREKLSHRLGDKAKTKVRTMASVLANGFKKGDKCHRLTVDEALMNHFGAIVMAAKLSSASEVVLIGDVNQLPYLDRENLFPLRYTRPDMVVAITQELLCTHRNPMDVALALSDIYCGIYSSKTSTSNIHSLRVCGFSGADIPKKSLNTLFLVHTQEEKSSLSDQGYGSGEGSRILTIHESQGLTYERVIVINTRKEKTHIRYSVPHAVVAVSRHTTSCVYYTDDASDAIGRFAKKAMDASTEAVVDYNLKTAIMHRNMAIVEALMTLKNSLLPTSHIPHSSSQ